MKKSQNRASHNHFTSQGYGASQEEHMYSTNKSQVIKTLTFITMEYQKKNLLKSGIKLLTQSESSLGISLVLLVITKQGNTTDFTQNDLDLNTRCHRKKINASNIM